MSFRTFTSMTLMVFSVTACRYFGPWADEAQAQNFGVSPAPTNATANPTVTTTPPGAFADPAAPVAPNANLGSGQPLPPGQPLQPGSPMWSQPSNSRIRNNRAVDRAPASVPAQAPLPTSEGPLY